MSDRATSTNGPACGTITVNPKRISGRVVAAAAELGGDAVTMSLTAARGGKRESQVFCMTPLAALQLASMLQMTVARGRAAR